MKKQAKITIDVWLDENQIPEKIEWNAPDGGVYHADAKAAFLTIWDEANQETLRLDLWTKEMSIDSMKKFIHQNIATTANLLRKATDDEESANVIEEFAVRLLKILKLSDK
ncbi:gliding motility protein GldC [Schleiferia thermophila]|jgi:gliding motility-associated protein GldC|uniref:Protein involved in gliding motility GldC n=1 Tax=Schleiferia thermophila TaxID=884107 RepID=A0A369A4H4_9FLAO|nr:gliding motility protein GldC [Schleiferia thermophila]KFD39187.1 gliding motility protein GldC [Schleiferia thermophila str. Yellowstone]RCX03308.1 protein involved in gliding motility GldC [Schleiferia thermophila]GCD80437.1 gliding motility protein GldC [Schleiferia thermophila]